jgi:hypothetical protein
VIAVWPSRGTGSAGLSVPLSFAWKALDLARQSRLPVQRLTRAAGKRRSAMQLIPFNCCIIGVVSERTDRETHSRYHWNTERDRTGVKCALVSGDCVRWLATLHLRHSSAVSGRSYGEWILHSKLHIPAPFVNHSAALESFFPILFRLTCQCWSFRVLDLNPMRLGGIEVH